MSESSRWLAIPTDNGRESAECRACDGLQIPCKRPRLSYAEHMTPASGAATAWKWCKTTLRQCVLPAPAAGACCQSLVVYKAFCVTAR